MAAKSSLPDQRVSVSRLKNRADFLKARNGARSHERAFVLQIRNRTEDQFPDCRVGFTVTKKVGNAVERNRIKRRLRAAVETAMLPFSCAGHDVVIIARRSALTLPFDALVEDLTAGLNKGFNKALLRRGRNNERHIAK